MLPANDKPKITGQRQWLTVIFGRVFLGLFLGAIGTFLVRDATRDIYPQIIPLGLGALLLLGGLALLVSVWYVESIDVYADRLVLRRYSGRVVHTTYLDQIQGWNAVHHKTKSKEWDELMLYGSDVTHTIRSDRYKNYPELFALLTKDRKLNTAPEAAASARGQKRTSMVVCSIGLLLLCISYKGCSSDNKPLTAQDLGTVADVLTEQPYIHKGSKGARWITVSVAQHSDFNFKIDGTNYDAMNVDAYIADMHEGDSIWLDVMIEDYLKKLTRQQPLGFFDKTVGYRDIDVYGLRDKERSYLSLKDYNAASSGHKSIFIILFFVGLGAVGIGIYIRLEQYY